MRLIDADKLIKQFHYGGIADTEEDKAWTATVRRTIKAQPTAYDIDKVVEQLWELQVDVIQHGREVDRVGEVVEEAIEIVRKGGVK